MFVCAYVCDRYISLYRMSTTYRTTRSIAVENDRCIGILWIFHFGFSRTDCRMQNYNEEQKPADMTDRRIFYFVASSNKNDIEEVRFSNHMKI